MNHIKISIFGYSGSGKSTLAESLGNHYQIPVLYLDKVQFLPGWKLRDDSEGRQIVADFMKQESWVIDGNYAKYMRLERLEDADYIIFMGFSRISCLIRVLKRYCKFKNTTRSSMADGCIEKLDGEFVRWVLYKGRDKRTRKQYYRILYQYHKKVFIIKNQKQLNRFMENLPLNI